MTDQLKSFIIVALLSIACVAVSGIRLVGSSSTYYNFLPWNLFLAWLPYLCSIGVTTACLRSGNIVMKVIVAAPLTVAWALLFPNAPYIVTDFLHLVTRKNNYYVDLWFNNKYWFDFFMLFLYAWTGILLGFFSLRQMHMLAGRVMSRAWSWAAVTGFCFLSGFGIYLGREIRLNSWDILSRPRILGHAVIDALHGSVILLSILFGLIVLIPFLTLYFLPSSRK